jgi:glycosyltransferase involved in cell wall biosynthesis
MTRVAYVIDSLAPGGAERSLVELLPHLMARGVDPTVVCLAWTEESLEPMVRSHGIPLVQIDARSRLATVGTLRALFRRERPDLIHTTLFESDLAGRLGAAGSGIPVLTTLAGSTYEPGRLDDTRVRASRLRAARAIDGWTARRLTRRLHAVSEDVKRSAVRSLRVDPERVVVIPRGRDPRLLGEPSEARRRAVREALGAREDSELVLAAGRQELPKGHRYLVEAAATLHRPRTQILVAGREGGESPALRELVLKLGLEGRVSFLGYREDVADLLAASDVFVMPSVREGSPGALIEAMAMAVPIVASDLPTIREILEHERSALLVPPRDPVAIAAAIDRLLDDPELRTKLATEARGLFQNRFTIAAIADRMVDLYRETLRETHPRLAGASS